MFTKDQWMFCSEKTFYKVKTPLNNLKLIDYAWRKIDINHICSEQYPQNVFLYTLFPQSFFIIPLWKLECVPFVRSHKISGCDPM